MNFSALGYDGPVRVWDRIHRQRADIRPSTLNQMAVQAYCIGTGHYLCRVFRFLISAADWRTVKLAATVDWKPLGDFDVVPVIDLELGIRTVIHPAMLMSDVVYADTDDYIEPRYLPIVSEFTGPGYGLNCCDEEKVSE